MRRRFVCKRSPFMTNESGAITRDTTRQIIEELFFAASE
jgi:hypothetical protein